MPPKVLTKNDRSSGVLPVNAATRNATTTPKPPAVRLKLEVRRLPPSLTVSEFEETLGEQWSLGKGRVDWREYRQGKIRSPGKLPEQSRCYIHLLNETFVKEFEQRFLATVFHDKAGTHKNAELRYLPPTLGYAPNQRVPTVGKHKVDNRQGTIDQDPEFIAFLEAETQPIVKPAALDAIGAGKDNVKVEVKSTPLIDDLREKKANKAKAAASKAERKAVKGDGKESATVVKDGGKAAKSEPKKVEQATKDAVKVLNKQAAAKQSQTSASATSASTQQKPTTPAKKRKERVVSTAPASPKVVNATPATAPQGSTTDKPAPQRMPPAQRARRDAEGIKKMLQKDLGIKPTTTGPARVRGSSQAVSASSDASASLPPIPQARSSTKPPTQNTTAAAAPATSKSALLPSSHQKAFLKHANPSQGMTDSLIKDALSEYGEVISVTIDPRKGTAIAVFGSPDVLQKAIQARKIDVASGAIEVLEFRDRSGTNAGAGRGGAARGAAKGGRGKAAVVTATTTTTPVATTASAG